MMKQIIVEGASEASKHLEDGWKIVEIWVERRSSFRYGRHVEDDVSLFLMERKIDGCKKP